MPQTPSLRTEQGLAMRDYACSAVITWTDSENQ